MTMQRFNRKTISFLSSLLDGLARTMKEGDEAMLRCFAGTPAPGDERRMRNALAVADVMALRRGNTEVVP